MIYKKFFLIGFIPALLSVFVSKAYAEYYDACASDPIPTAFVESAPCAKWVKHKKHVKHVKHHRPKVHHRSCCVRPASYAEVTVYRTVDVTPAVCSSCQPCATSTCSSCSSCRSSDIYTVPAANAYMMDQFYGEYNFDFDRRTADDVGVGMNIDY